ncbi:hypothetical protein GUITHDRAFT_105016 [Guillardia theta CCMP2712]|uniref:Pseudouridine synthase RsuA/RluA-like domain-containing protein n=1 Tax=Guillardia theta (strain CCMP2712) TaxID=905079 RepID=L1JLQ9_GUITC|nr:hypothetical protein GUITHDRAFT_105016 [Guillardia theta CCMP2712]EKX49491.1 hypothetical protein GUITHDRAFT_105016 [Guillardia theta CCMP2712]|eukprot:XP_005836471.1 hypothetical protein GUITHDRAFT_105016 [Guillardia theta CCMP2712]
MHHYKGKSRESDPAPLEEGEAERIRSPVNGKLIKVGGPSFRKLVDMGYTYKEGKLTKSGAVRREATTDPVVAEKGAVGSKGWRLLHEDDDILVVDKAEGVLTVPGVRQENKDSLLTRLEMAYPGVTCVHRLDRDTSGQALLILVLGRSRSFEDKLVTKLYIAMVEGVVPAPVSPSDLEPTWGTIDYPIGKDEASQIDNKCWVRRMKVDFEHGRPCLSRYRVLEVLSDPPRTLVLLFPGSQRVVDMSETAGAGKRLLLHAFQICFRHPSTDQELTFHAPCPFVPEIQQPFAMPSKSVTT